MTNQQVLEILQDLTYTIENTVEEINSKPKNEYLPELIMELCEKLSNVNRNIIIHYIKD